MSNPFFFAPLTTELHRVIVGQDYLIERLLIALLAEGHVLLEGVPGLAKTKTLTALTQCISAKMQRIQFTPDLLPADLVGTEVYRPQSGEFVIRQGPIFSNFVLADEINRAPSKVQSALLQAMEERQVTIGEATFELPTPFFVLATQNPIEQEGTYPLPEAQLDRFLMKVKVGYPTAENELEILRIASATRAEQPKLSAVMTLDDLRQAQHRSNEVFIDPKIDRYIVNIVHATRNASSFGLKGMVEWGASPRASLSLRKAAQKLAFLRGKSFVTPNEVKDMAHDVLRHRILVSFEAEARCIQSDEVITHLLKEISVP